MAPEVMKHFLTYRWPGNVRELENTVERLVILTTGDTITLDQISDTVRTTPPGQERIPLDIPESGIDLEGLLQNTEKTLLFKALEKTGGVKTEAARLLGLSFRSFRHRLQKYEQPS
jgi:two-component system response regulator PilR (NtrC family)